MRSSRIILAGLLMVTLAVSLHLQDSTQAQIDALKAQQTNFEQNVGKLLTNLSQIEKSLNSTSNIDQKVIILENAIISERESVFELSKIIIPPFNISKSGCEKMTDQQKVELLEQISEARKQVLELKNISLSMPKCDDVDQIKRDIEKQIFFLNSIESILYTNCSMNVILSPTIWQTNIYAPNWVLGNMTIDDLIEQYYQRSIRYDNITNCHVETPFFDGKQCIICPTATPIFDISQKKCLACPAESKIDNAQKKCVPIKRYTNFDNLVNFYPSTGPFPTPDPDAVPCPKEAPYFNGTGCMVCNLPQYFDVASQTCKNCPAGTVYGLNQRQCTQVQKNMLTKLQNTRWVTGPNNFTTVLQQRQAILESNATSGKYQECPDASPYYDSISCIDCAGQEFDLNTLKCVTAPKGTQFNPNIHNYIPPMTNGETLGTAPNLIGKPPANDPAIPDCTQDKPYWDGISCIACPDPFIYFDLSTKACVVCDPKDYYDAATRSCLPRKTIYISTNEDKLLATPAQSIADYKNKIAKTIDSNPNAIIVNCDSATQYSDFNTCFNCAANEYFNVETLKCEVCVGKYDTTSKLCVKEVPPVKIQYYTNLDSPYIVSIGDTAQEQQTINDQVQKDPASNKICNIDTPYSPDGAKCIKCNPPEMYFDYKKKTCVGCLDNQFLDADGNCVDSPLVSNVAVITASNKYIETQPDATIATINKNIQSLKDSGSPYLECSQNQPYYNPTTKSCTSLCSAGQYLDLATSKCIPCTTYDAKTHTCPPPVVNYADLSNPNWIAKNPAAVTQQRDSLKSQPGSQICPSTAPFLSKGNCVACSPPTPYFNFDTQNCEACATFNSATHTCPPPVVNYADLSNPNWIAKNPAAVTQQRDSLKSQPGSQICPSTTPFLSKGNCVACSPPTPYFNFDTQNCEACAVFDAAGHSCSQVNPNPQYPNMADPNWLTSDITKLSAQVAELKSKPGATICPAATPHYNGAICLVCSDPTPLFNYDSKKCDACPAPKVFDVNVHQCLTKLNEGLYQTNIDSPSLMYRQPYEYWQGEYSANKAKYPNIKDCPATNYYWDGINCIQCFPGMYFSLDYKMCLRCPAGTAYDASNANWKGCVSTSSKQRLDIKPDVAKMYANIF